MSDIAYRERPEVARRRRRNERIKAPFKAVGRFVATLYRRHVYRHHMRAIHLFGWHWFKRLHPFGGEGQKWCQWCGERHIIYPAISVRVKGD